ncbi:hypothetical protein HMI55_007259 [Coelomomyces lativittatus]|nr:hypothetical protein HMI55_007259 [Coelomomyces lativittatus]KAJ1510340.1 hypothetical protein HMI56_006383 [Coelomomyces lativittatus]
MLPWFLYILLCLYCLPKSQEFDSSTAFFANLQTDVSSNIENIKALDATIVKILELPYFRYIKMDLYKECPFWREDAVCTNRQCSVQVLDEGLLQNEAPYMYHDQNLGDLSSPSRPKPSFLQDCASGRDFCILEDELAAGGLYVDLSKNPERFTGYSGVSANKVWQAIYGENCFHANPLDVEPMCIEKQMFYKIVSGLHTSISVHICSQYLDRSTGEWKANETCFQQRIAPFPDRIENAIFVHSILVRAVSQLNYFFQQQLNFCTGDQTTSGKGKHFLKELTLIAARSSKFNENLFFQGSYRGLVEEFRMKFLNISRIMDCVACQKCRLWGKTQITGLGAALKVLFKTDPATLTGQVSPMYSILTRFEVVALLNTLHRFTESLKDIYLFQSKTPLSPSSFHSYFGMNEYFLLAAFCILFTIPLLTQIKSDPVANFDTKKKGR